VQCWTNPTPLNNGIERCPREIIGFYIIRMANDQSRSTDTLPAIKISFASTKIAPFLTSKIIKPKDLTELHQERRIIHGNISMAVQMMEGIMLASTSKKKSSLGL